MISRAWLSVWPTCGAYKYFFCINEKTLRNHRLKCLAGNVFEKKWINCPTFRIRISRFCRKSGLDTDGPSHLASRAEVGWSRASPPGTGQTSCHVGRHPPMSLSAVFSLAVMWSPQIGALEGCSVERGKIICVTTVSQACVLSNWLLEHWLVGFISRNPLSASCTHRWSFVSWSDHGECDTHKWVSPLEL